MTEHPPPTEPLCSLCFIWRKWGRPMGWYEHKLIFINGFKSSFHPSLRRRWSAVGSGAVLEKEQCAKYCHPVVRFRLQYSFATFASSEVASELWWPWDRNLTFPPSVLVYKGVSSFSLNAKHAVWQLECPHWTFFKIWPWKGQLNRSKSLAVCFFFCILYN